MQRSLLLFLIFGWAAVLIGFMELHHEYERIGPETTLVTNHFTGEVKYCHVYRSGDMSCHDVDIKPRHWLFALIPLWPGREELNQDLQRKPSAREAPFTETPLFEDLLVDGIIVMVMLAVTALVMRITREEGDGSGDGGSDGSGAF